MLKFELIRHILIPKFTLILSKIKRLFNSAIRLQELWRTSELASIELLLSNMLIIGLICATTGFSFGIPCSSFYFWGSFLLVTIAAGCHSWQRLLSFILTTAVIFLLTAFTFTYTGTDAGNYHLPMQRLLIEGWNPIFTSTIEEFTMLTANTGTFSLYHTLFLPKVSALCGALVAKGTGLWSADAFLGYTLIYLLFSTAYRFSGQQWSASKRSSCLFAFSLTCSTKITSFLAGQVDYTAYAALMTAILSLALWVKSMTLRNLITLGVGLIFCMTSKTTGFICGFLLLGIGCISSYRCTKFWFFAICTMGIVLLIGAAPLLTAWIQYGAPFYPSITFDPAIQPIDITSDFIGNSDGEQMGFLARIIYAWFSQTLAIHGCAWFYSQSEFSPEFYVAGGVAGLGTCFRFLFCMSILFLLLSKKNTTFWIALFILISSNLAPLKYIGYNRYFPQMWALPFLALFNFFYASKINFSNTWWHRFRRCAFFGVCLFLLPIFLRTLAYQTRQLILESERQTVLQHLKGQSFKLAPEDNTFTIRSRLLADAITVTPNATQLDVNQKDILFGKDAETKAHTLRKQIPICDTPQQLLTFPWHKLLGNIPKPIFDTPPLK